MQTFLPYPDLVKSASMLDNKRLGKQRVEAYQILNALKGESSGWQNHPAVKMWKGYEDALALYMNVCILEWRRRGFNNTMKLNDQHLHPVYPKWFGDKEFHKAHQSNLLRKEPDFYRRYNWKVSDDLAYIWPK